MWCILNFVIEVVVVFNMGYIKVDVVVGWCYSSKGKVKCVCIVSLNIVRELFMCVFGNFFS